MKILYGVQATGNGHITRAHAMNKALKDRNIEVDYLFSGRERDKLFDMEPFGDFECRRGMTFITRAGKVKVWETWQQNSFKQLWHDIHDLDLSAFDLVLTDFEPITAWAARRQKKPSIAIGHQYAFDHAIPKRGNNPATALFMQYFAPGEIRLGLHWHPFGCPILPPIAHIPEHSSEIQENKILVYLGFEELEQIIAFIQPQTDYEFHVYANIPAAEQRGHIHLHPLNREGFQRDLNHCNGVITNAGFELASESIHLGKKLLVKPLKGQMEQLSNAKALEMLGLGMSMGSLDQGKLTQWLEGFKGKRVIYPDVPAALAEWIESGKWAKEGGDKSNELISTLWEQTTSPDIPDFMQLWEKDDKSFASSPAPAPHN